MLKIEVDEERILASIYRSQNFSEVVAVLKNSKSTYDPALRKWEIGLRKLEDIAQAVSNFEAVDISDSTRNSIELLKKKTTSLKSLTPVGVLSDLKVPPVKGKPPFEDYQWQDIQRALQTNRLGFGHQQGLGKSFISISTIHLLEKYRKVKKILFITSNSGVLSLAKEFLKFSDIPKDQIIIGGTHNRRPFDNTNARVILMNYRSFLLVSDDYQKDHNSKTKDYRKCPIPVSNWLQGDQGILVLDESHNVANPKARQTKALFLIAPFFEYRYLASGTPADKPEKWFSQLKIMDNGLVGNQSYTDWLNEYADIGNRFSAYAINFFKPYKLKQLQDISSRHWIRRFSEDTLELPDNIKKKIYVSMTPEHREIYESVVESELKYMQNKGAITSRNVYSAFPHIMSSIDNPEILLDNEETLREKLAPFAGERIYKAVKKFKFDKHHAKVEATIDLLEEHGDSKTVIWVSHPSTAHNLMIVLAKYNPVFVDGTSEKEKGEQTDQMKERIVSKFREDPECRVLIASIQSLNSAMTIVESNVQIYFDSTFNFTIFDQSMKRIHRIGQDKHVYTYFLVFDSSLNVLQYKNLEEKDYINSTFLNKEIVNEKDLKDIFTMEG